MNRQVNYIIYAMLLSLSLPIGYYFIDKIISAENASQKEPLNPTAEKVIVESPADKSAAAGKMLFFNKCASCHQIFKNSTGPALMSLEERGPWNDRKSLYSWIRNPAKFMLTNDYTKNLKKEFGSMMVGFPDLTDDEIDAIVDYVHASQICRQVIY